MEELYLQTTSTTEVLLSSQSFGGSTYQGSDKRYSSSELFDRMWRNDWLFLVASLSPKAHFSVIAVIITRSNSPEISGYFHRLTADVVTVYGRSKDYICVLETQMHLHLFNIWLEYISNRQSEISPSWMLLGYIYTNLTAIWSTQDTWSDSVNGVTD